LKQAKNVADLKAVNMNLMHSNLSITDGVLSTADVRQRIAGLGMQIVETGQALPRDLADQLMAGKNPR
jgi:hypothetical protein